MLQKILILCHANICRSPVAEALLRAQAEPDITVQSAGLYAIPGLPAASEMITLLQKRHIDLSAHRSRQATPELLAWADLVLVMDLAQQRETEKKFPHALGKVHLLGKWENCGIPDPFQRAVPEYEQSIQLIERCLQGWQERLWR